MSYFRKNLEGFLDLRRSGYTTRLVEAYSNEFGRFALLANTEATAANIADGNKDIKLLSPYLLGKIDGEDIPLAIDNSYILDVLNEGVNVEDNFKILSRQYNEAVDGLTNAYDLLESYSLALKGRNSTIKRLTAVIERLGKANNYWRDRALNVK